MMPESEDALQYYATTEAGHFVSKRINCGGTQSKKVSRRGSKKLAVYSYPDVLICFCLFALVLAQLSSSLWFASMKEYYDMLSPNGPM